LIRGVRSRSPTCSWRRAFLAPQGLQVGFIEGKSSISQTVTLAKGTYTLSLLAAQAARKQSPQSLDVFVDTTQVGTIKPSDPKYAQFLIDPALPR